MASGKVFQSLRNFRQEFNRMIFDGTRKACDLGMQFRRNRLEAEALKRLHQRMRKAVQAVTVRHYTFPLHIIQNFAYLLSGKLVVIQKRNEARNGSLKINVVLPKRVIGVDKKSLCGQASSSWLLANQGVPVCRLREGWACSRRK